MQGVPHTVRVCDSALGAPNGPLGWGGGSGGAHMCGRRGDTLYDAAEELPFVGLADGRVVAGPDVLKALARAGVTPATTELSAVQQADAAAYLALLHHTLRPAWVRSHENVGAVWAQQLTTRAAQLYTLWYDADNYARVARPLSGARLPFPLSYAVPWTARAHVTDALTRDRPVLDRDEVSATSAPTPSAPRGGRD
jgi:hypothetical protein